MVKETDGFCLALPIAVLTAGQDGSRSKVQEVISTLSSWPTAVSHGTVAAKMVQSVILNPDQDVITEIQAEIAGEDFADVTDSLRAVDKYLDQDHVQVVGTIFGRPCYNPGSVQGALHALRKSDYDLAAAVRLAIRAGGCCCSRSVLIGALSGAKNGIQGIPEDWIAKTSQAERVLEAALKIFK